MNEVTLAREIATKAHADTNHLYDGKPYSAHLETVVAWAEYLLPMVYPYTTRENMDIHVPILCACWLHDVIEDCRFTYNDVRDKTNARIADLVYAVTNEKGRNRHQRANYKYYSEMAKVEGAQFVEMCDRLANIEYSILSKSKMFKMYKEEHERFLEQMDVRGNGLSGMSAAVDIMDRMIREGVVYDKNVRKQMIQP